VSALTYRSDLASLIARVDEMRSIIESHFGRESTSASR
jgi:hypothetical protein